VFINQIFDLAGSRRGYRCRRDPTLRGVFHALTGCSRKSKQHEPKVADINEVECDPQQQRHSDGRFEQALPFFASNAPQTAASPLEREHNVPTASTSRRDSTPDCRLPMCWSNPRFQTAIQGWQRPSRTHVSFETGATDVEWRSHSTDRRGLQRRWQTTSPACELLVRERSTARLRAEGRSLPTDRQSGPTPTPQPEWTRRPRFHACC